MRRTLTILIFIFLGFSLYATTPSCESHNKKAEKLYNKAIDLLRTGQKKNREEAYKILINAVKIDPTYVDANFVLADVNYQKYKLSIVPQQKEQLANRALQYYEAVIKECPSHRDYEVYYYMSDILYKRHEYKKVEEYLNIYDTNSKNSYYYRQTMYMLIRVRTYFDLLNHPVAFNPQKLEGVCSTDDEFLPLISPDGELAFFTHRNNIKGKPSSSKKIKDELSISYRKNPNKKEKEIYNSPKTMPYPFNQEGVDQGAMCMTIDNKQLYITICKFVKGPDGPFKNCDIYVSYFNDGKWSELKNLGPNINGKFSWESQPTISADGKILYFSSIRPSNIGFDYKNNQTADIYYSEKLPNGEWGKAKNIGPTINTSGNEKSPFIHTDSQTLYFASDELPGMGGYDIFYTQKKKNKWIKPRNIGYPINKKADDLGFIVSTNGEKAYFSSNTLDDKNGWDIYSFDLYKEARPKSVLFVKGQLKDKEGNCLTDAKVSFVSSRTNKKTEGMVDKKTGSYAIAMAVEDDEEVLMTVTKKNYSFTSKYFKPKDIKKAKTTKKVDLKVQPVKIGETVKINDIQFASNSTMFMKGSILILNNFIQFLQNNPKIKIEIHGHTDNVGGARANKKLSTRRAETIRNYLVFQGIEPSRIVAYKGFGESKPIASNKTEAGKAKNRRTEFVIVER